MSKILPDEMCPCGSGKTFGVCHGPKVRKYVLPNIDETQVLNIIAEPDPNTRTVFISTSTDTIFFRGNVSNKALVCGNCSAPLIVGVADGQIKGIVMQCNRCKSFNET